MKLTINKGEIRIEVEGSLSECTHIIDTFEQNNRLDIGLKQL